MTIPILFLTAAIAAAQSGIRGSVQDPLGKPIDGAELVLYRAGAAQTLARAQTRQGQFIFSGIARGHYLIEASAEGFRRTSLRVTTEDPVTIRLEVAGVDQRILVTAEGAAQTIDQVSKAASVITMDEISQRNEYSVSEALKDTPGMLVRNLGGPGQSTTLRIRGLRTDATAVLIDGLRLRDAATTQADASTFTSTLNVINLDRIEVLRGSGSSLYGTNAVGGTVNVVTDPGGGSLHGGLQMEGGSLGLIRGRATLAGGLRDNRLTYSAGILHLNVMSGIDGNDRTRSSGIQSFTRYTVTPRFSLSARVFSSDDFVQPNLSPTATGLPAANIPNTVIVEAIPLARAQVLRSSAGLPITPGNATFIPNRDDPDNRRASRFTSAAFIARYTPHATFDLQTSFQRVHTNRTFRNGPAGAGSQPAVSNLSQFRAVIDTSDTRLVWRLRPWYTLSGGYEWEREDYLNGDNNNLPPPATLSTRTEAGQKAHALYFANQITALQQRLQFSLSGRTQSFSLQQPRFIYSGLASPYDSFVATRVPRAVTGDAAVSYFLPATGTKLRVHGGNSYRAPGLYERYGSGFFYSPVTNSVGFTPYGDPRLSPDRYNSIDAGIDQYLFHDKLRLSATWFYTRIVQITQFDSAASIVRPSTDIFGRSSGYFNGAGGASRGIETTAELRPLRSTLLRGSYSYVNADTDQDTAVRGFFRALSVPAHSGTFFLHQQLGRKTDVTLDIFRSSQYYNSLSAAGRARAYLYPGLTKVDLVCGRQLWTSEQRLLKAYVKVENIFHQEFYENGFRGPGATFLTGLQLLFR